MVQSNVRCTNGAREYRRVQESQVQVTLCRESNAGRSRFDDTLLDEVNVVPTGKEVEFVPLGTTVAQ